MGRARTRIFIGVMILIKGLLTSNSQSSFLFIQVALAQPTYTKRPDIKKQRWAHWTGSDPGFVFYLLLRRSISDYRSMSYENVTCPRPPRTTTQLKFEPGTSRPKVLSFTTARVRYTNWTYADVFRPIQMYMPWTQRLPHLVLLSI